MQTLEHANTGTCKYQKNVCNHKHMLPLNMQTCNVDGRGYRLSPGGHGSQVAAHEKWITGVI